MRWPRGLVVNYPILCVNTAIEPNQVGEIYSLTWESAYWSKFDLAKYRPRSLIGGIPVGSFVVVRGESFLLCDGKCYDQFHWSPVAAICELNNLHHATFGSAVAFG